jgi:hypothetical protein
MSRETPLINVVLETGKARVFATASKWPGWSRSDRDEPAALLSLLNYGSQYQQVMQRAQIPFDAPLGLADLAVIERLQGNETTDFGAPNLVWTHDYLPVSEDELELDRKILQAVWAELDESINAGLGKALRKGPRGGGRDLLKIIDHVYEVDVAYLRLLGGKINPQVGLDVDVRFRELRREIFNTLTAAVFGEIPEVGLRGGKRWTARYFVRRLAWHELDHAWEIISRIDE